MILSKITISGGNSFKSILKAVKFIILFLIISFPAFSETKIEIDSEKQYSLSELFFNKSDYFRAITEYQRFINFFPEDDKIKTAMYKIAVSYFKSERFKEAIEGFKLIIDKYPKDDISINSYFIISESYEKKGELENAISTLNNLLLLSKQNDIKDKIYFKLVFLYTKMMLWQEARTAFNKISHDNKDKYDFKKLDLELDNEKSNLKNPKIAGILSLIPGLGFFYTNRYQDALIAFLFNSGLIIASYEEFKSNNIALGSIIGFVELGFYAGNIYGAVSSAHKYNKTHINNYVENLKMNISFSSTKYNDGVKLFFNYSF